MVLPRIIPCLLIHSGGVAKTVRFKDAKYVGDPINSVRILNEKEVDELIVLDIDATALGREPDYSMIAHLANECRMPLCYGGGVRTVEQIQKIISYGVEKVAVSAAAVRTPDLVSHAAKQVGGQSVVVVMDVKRSGRPGGYEVFTQNGRDASGVDPVTLAQRMQELGAGEIVINSIDRDGTMEGYELDLASRVREAITLPLTILGGAGSLRDIEALIGRFGIIGACAGSLFVFKGKYRAVLINYPNRAEKDAIVEHGLKAHEKRT